MLKHVIKNLHFSFTPTTTTIQQQTTTITKKLAQKIRNKNEFFFQNLMFNSTVQRCNHKKCGQTYICKLKHYHKWRHYCQPLKEIKSITKQTKKNRFKEPTKQRTFVVLLEEILWKRISFLKVLRPKKLSRKCFSVCCCCCFYFFNLFKSGNCL